MAKREQIIQEAEKLVARGKLDAAIREYERALELSRQDTGTLNRLGDLLVKANRIDEAVEVYRKIAEHFADDGFFLKSIAIYKKMNRFSPQRTEIYERLADLYYKQGLAVEGRQQLVALADWYVRAEQTEEAVRIYRRLAELEPTNLQLRGRLVDLLVQSGESASAVEEIDEVGQTLLSRSLFDEAVKLYRRALDLGPGDGGFVARCIDALMESERLDQAVDLAGRALRSGAGGLELKRAAAVAFGAAGDLARARELFAGLVQGEAGRRPDVLRAYADVLVRQGDLETAKDVVLPAVDRSIELRDRRAAAALIARLLDAETRDLDILERAARVLDRREDPETLVAVETHLADVYYETGRGDEALPLYRRLAQQSPSNPLFSERLRELGGGGMTAGAPGAEQVRPVGEHKAAVSMPAPLAEVELPLFEPSSVEAPEPGLPSDAETVGPATGMAVAEEAPSAASETTIEELYTEAVVFAKYGLADKAVDHLSHLLSIDPTHGEALALMASLAPSRTAADSAVADPAVADPAAADLAAADAAAEAVGGAAGGIGTAVGQAAPATADLSGARDAAELPAAALPPSAGATRRIRLEDLEAALGVGRVGKRGRPTASARPMEVGAVDLAPEVEAPPAFAPPLEWSPSADGSPEIAPLPDDSSAAPEFAEPAESVEVLAEAAEEVELGDVLRGPEVERLREIDLYLEQGLLEEAGRSLATMREAFPEHPDVVSRQAVLKARGWDETAPVGSLEGASAEELFSEEEQFFDLAAALERELADEELVAEATGAGQEAEVSIEDLFKEFQRGVAEQVGEEDFDTHFNLGLAYREMGLYDEAIGEFQLAAKSSSYFVECCTMVAACYTDRGLPEQAFQWYERALKAPDLPPEAEVGLRYEMGRSQEAAGNPDAALAYYAEVLAINPNFRDVVQRVSTLQS